MLWFAEIYILDLSFAILSSGYLDKVIIPRPWASISILLRLLILVTSSTVPLISFKAPTQHLYLNAPRAHKFYHIQTELIISLAPFSQSQIYMLPSMCSLINSTFFTSHPGLVQATGN